MPVSNCHADDTLLITPICRPMCTGWLPYLESGEHDVEVYRHPADDEAARDVDHCSHDVDLCFR